MEPKECKGADRLAYMFSYHRSTGHLPMPANWSELGTAAGPARNGEMVSIMESMRRCGWEVSTLAFPTTKSKGTWDFVRQAKAAGFEVKITKL